MKLIRHIPDFEFVFLLTAFVPVDSPTLTTQFSTFVRYFSHILFSISPHNLIFNQFFSPSYGGIDLFYLLYIISQRHFHHCEKISLCLLIDRLCAYRFANSHHTVLHIIGSLFYACSLFYHIPLRYLTGFLYIPM